MEEAATLLMAEGPLGLWDCNGFSELHMWCLILITNSGECQMHVHDWASFIIQPDEILLSSFPSSALCQLSATCLAFKITPKDWAETTSENTSAFFFFFFSFKIISRIYKNS